MKYHEWLENGFDEKTEKRGKKNYIFQYIPSRNFDRKKKIRMENEKKNKIQIYILLGKNSFVRDRHSIDKQKSTWKYFFPNVQYDFMQFWQSVHNLHAFIPPTNRILRFIKRNKKKKMNFQPLSFYRFHSINSDLVYILIF